MSATPCLIVDIPGPVGPAGAAGTAGTNGVNAWTTVAAQFAMPAEGASTVVSVVDASWMAIGQKVFLGDPLGAARGTFEVIAIAANSVTLNNLENAATSAYLDNSIAGTVFPIGTVVSPSGLQGPAGALAAGSAPDDATYITQTPNGTLSAEQALSGLGTGLMKVTTATGVITSVPIGIAAGNAALVDVVALTSGQSVFATALGLESKTAATARMALGLTLGVADTNIAPVNDAGGLVAGELLRATATGIESITTAAAQTQLGIGGGVGAWAVYRYTKATTVSSDAFIQTGWRQVVLNSELVDTGAIGTLAGGVVTLIAGTYRARWVIPGWKVEKFSSRLRCIAGSLAGTTLGLGTNAKAGAALDVSTVTIGECRFTAALNDQIQLEAQCQLTGLFGEANSFGETEVYGTLELEKET